MSTISRLVVPEMSTVPATSKAPANVTFCALSIVTAVVPASLINKLRLTGYTMFKSDPPAVVRFPPDSRVRTPALSIVVPPPKVEVPATAKVVAISTAPSMSTMSRLVVPATSKSVPTNNFLAIPTPPSTIRAPEVELVESVVRFKLTAPLESRVVTVAAAAEPDPRIPSSVPVNPVAVI